MRVDRDWSMGGPRGWTIRLGGATAPGGTRGGVVFKGRGLVVKLRRGGEAEPMGDGT